MKATVEIADALLLEAKALAAERNTTLRQIIEEGLRTVLETRGTRCFRLQDKSFSGKGASTNEWPEIRRAIYEGRGD